MINKRKKNIKRTVLSFISLILSGIAFFLGVFFIKKTTPLKQEYIAHAGGAYKGQIYLNVEESFIEHYNKGIRMFEYDLMFSSDKQIIGTHLFENLKGWGMTNRPTYSEYIDHFKDLDYTGVTLDFIFEIIESYPDLKIIVDTKENDEVEIMKEILTQATIKNIDVSNSIIPQIYSEKSLEGIADLSFETYIFSNYKSGYTQGKIIKLINTQPKIKIVTISSLENLLFNNKKINDIGVEVAVNTISFKPLADFFFHTGVSYIYTDSLP